MKNTQYFVTENGQIHAYYPESEINTTGNTVMTINNDTIVFNDGRYYTLYYSVKDVMASIKDVFENNYAFVDDDGVIHALAKDLSKTTYISQDNRMSIRLTSVGVKEKYTMFYLVDPEGIIADDGGFVVWESQDLAKELDK